jgi:hypothetical protein
MRGEPSSLRSPVTVHFACPNCGLVYTGLQEHIGEKLVGHFDCTFCMAEVHSWTGVYDYSIWKIVATKPAAAGRKHDKHQNALRLTMKDLRAKLEKLLTEAEDCEIIGRLAADKKKRELFRRRPRIFAAWREISRP